MAITKFPNWRFGRLSIMGRSGPALIGRQFGRLKVLSEAPHVFGEKRSWICACRCGERTVVTTPRLSMGRTRSCGCLQEEHRACFRTHGLTGVPEYYIWKNAKGRCYNRNRKDYSNYGGRGIRMCKRWRHSFASFYRDMGPRPSSRHSIDRINNDGHYRPGNCRWTTMSEQRKNQRKRRKR